MPWPRCRPRRARRRRSASPGPGRGAARRTPPCVGSSAPAMPAPRGGIAGILDVADPHARRHVGRRGAVDDHLGAAVVDVVVRRQHRQARRLEPHLDVLRASVTDSVRSDRETTCGVAVTTMRAAPCCSSGTLCLPNGRVIAQVIGVGLRRRVGRLAARRARTAGYACRSARASSSSASNRAPGAPTDDLERRRPVRRADPAVSMAMDGRRRRVRRATKSAAGDDGRDENNETRSQRSMDSHHTSLLGSRVPIRPGRRYRLGVRTRGSQPRDRGSIPRTATTI